MALRDDQEAVDRRRRASRRGAVHPSRSARNHLRWLAQSNGIPKGRADQVLDLVGLSSAARRRAGTFSLGMRQRLGVAAALLGDPPILILDEPTIGLDPEGIHWMRETLRALAAEGRTVFVSSHLMSELEDTADQLIVIGKGRLLADVSVDELIATASGDRVEIKTPDATTAMTVLANAGATVISNGRDRVAVQGMPARAGGRAARLAPGPTRGARVEQGRRSRRPTSSSRAAPESTRASRSQRKERRA